MARFDRIGAAHQPGGGRAWWTEGSDQHTGDSRDPGCDMSPEREHALGRGWSYGDSIADD